MPVGWGLMKRQFVEPVDRLVALAERLEAAIWMPGMANLTIKAKLESWPRPSMTWLDALRNEQLSWNLSYHDV